MRAKPHSSGMLRRDATACWLQYPRDLLSKNFIFFFFPLSLFFKACGGQLCRDIQWVKTEVMQALFWNCCNLQVLLPSSVMVPEGYVGNEARVCFVLANKSGQICVPEPVLQGVFSRESCSCWWPRSLWANIADIFMSALISEKFVIGLACAQRELFRLWSDHYWILARF